MILGKRFVEFVRNKLFFSFKSTINVFYISIIILFVSITGGVSYFLAIKQIEENTYTNVNDTILQTNNYLEFILTDIFQQLVSLSNDPNITALLASHDGDISPRINIEMDEDLNTIYYRYNSVIESIYVDINHGKQTYTVNSQLIRNQSFSYKNYFSKFQGNKESYYWENVHQDPIFSNGDQVISVFRLLGNEKELSQGIILFNLRSAFFEEILNKSLIGENGYLALISPDGSFESKNVVKPYRLDTEILKKLNQLDVKEGQFSFVNSEGEKMIIVYNTIGVNKWKVAAIVPEGEILQKINYIKYFTIIFVVFIIILATFLVHIIGKYISKPIEKLAEHMTTEGPSNISIANGLVIPDEMKILYSSFDQLTERNKKLLNQVKLDQEEMSQLEIAIIQAQINPHFLYNTLYSIKGLCDMGMNEEASQMITALSNFFRISISKGKEIISIKEEIQHIENYLFIMEMRYGDDFSYTLEVDDELLAYDIIKLTLQPLVENAIYHGVKQKRGQGYIHIRVFEKDELIYLEVQDNGLGIAPDKLSKIKQELQSPYMDQNRQNIGVGLKSVKERIKSYFGTEYGLWIESEEAMGTKITIIIPKVKEGNNDE